MDPPYGNNKESYFARVCYDRSSPRTFTSPPVCCTRWRDRQPCAEDTGYDVSGDGIPQSEIDANAEIASAEAAAAEEVHLTWSNNVRSS